MVGHAASCLQMYPPYEKILLLLRRESGHRRSDSHWYLCFLIVSALLTIHK